MKRVYLCLNLLLFSVCLSAQANFNFVSSQRHGVFRAIDVNASRQVIAVGSYDSCPEGYAVFFDADGSVLWERLLMGSLTPATDVFFSQDGQIVIVGSESTADDVGSVEDGIYLLKLDTLGNMLNSSDIDYDSYLTYPVFAIELPSTNILTAVDNDLFWFNNAGDSLNHMALGSEQIIDLETGPNGSILLLTRNTATWINESGEILGQRSASSGFVAACTKADTSWVIDELELLHFAGNISDPDIFNMVPGVSPSGITCFENREGMLLWDASDHFYHHLYGSMSVLSYPLTQNVTLHDVFATDQQIFVAGTEIWETPIINESLRGAFVQSISTNHTPDTMFFDLQLQLVDLVQTQPLDTLEEFPSGPYLVTAEFSGSITVANLSNDTIRNFVIFSERLGGFNCSEGRHYQLVDSILLLPGEEMEVPVVFHDYDTFANGEAATFDRCFYVAAPNNHFDPNQANNSSCQTLLSSTREKVNPNLQMVVHPNPASHQFTISLQKEMPIRAFTLYDLNGRSYSLDHQIHFNRIEVEVRNLPAGMYIAQVKTAEGIGATKLVIR